MVIKYYWQTNINITAQLEMSAMSLQLIMHCLLLMLLLLIFRLLFVYLKYRLIHFVCNILLFRLAIEEMGCIVRIVKQPKQHYGAGIIRENQFAMLAGCILSFTG